MEKTFVLFNGTKHDTDKVVSLSKQGVKSSCTSEEYSKLEGIDVAPFSEKIRVLIITNFEGKTIALVKPFDLENQLAKGKVKTCFYSKFLMKKLTATDYIIDTTPIYTRENDYENNRSEFQKPRHKPEREQSFRESKPRNSATKNALEALMKNSPSPRRNNSRNIESSDFTPRSYKYSEGKTGSSHRDTSR